PVAHQACEHPVAVRNVILTELEGVVGARLLLFLRRRQRDPARAERENDRKRDLLIHGPPLRLRRRYASARPPYRIIMTHSEKDCQKLDASTSRRPQRCA